MWVEVCYALAQEQVLLKLEIPAGARLDQAIKSSGILHKFPQIDLRRDKVGVFGTLRSLDALLTEGDRVEIYRALAADPKTLRHERVASARRARARVQSQPRKKTGFPPARE